MTRTEKIEAIRKKAIEAKIGQKLTKSDFDSLERHGCLHRHKCEKCGAENHEVFANGGNLVSGGSDKLPCTHGNRQKELACGGVVQSQEFSRFRLNEIRLADVLLALDTNVDFKKDFPSADFENFCFNRWNLRADDLTLQSDETINFIYDLVK